MKPTPQHVLQDHRTEDFSNGLYVCIYVAIFSNVIPDPRPEVLQQAADKTGQDGCDDPSIRQREVDDDVGFGRASESDCSIFINGIFISLDPQAITHYFYHRKY